MTRALIFAQTLICSSVIAQPVPLTVQPGAALNVELKSKVRVKDAGVPVEGRLVAPIYVFDKIVIPAGSQISGHVASVEKLSKGRRAMAIMSGDLTPLRKAQVDFDTVTFPDGKKLALHTTVSQGVPRVVHLTAGEKEKKKGRVAGAVAQAEQNAKDRVHQTIQQVKAPGKWERAKEAMLSELPYRRQWLPAGTRFSAELTAPLEFGKTEPAADALAQVGSEIPAGSIVRVLLETKLSSAEDHVGSPVRAVVSEPLFSADHHLILPAGTILEGGVTQVKAARRFHRNGQLRFTFRDIELTPGVTRQVQTSVEGVEAAATAHMQLDSEGGAKAVTPKTNYIGPAIDVVLALGSLDGLDPHRKLHPDFHQGPDVAGGTVRGGAGFKLIGSLVGLAAHYRPVSATLAFYGLGWSVYTHFLTRGTEVEFAKDTPMEIRFGTHQGAPPSAQKLAANK